jgi:hypothetical protein
MTTGDPTVFVIDDDDLVERPFKALVKSVGLHTDTFEIPPPSNASRQPILLVAPTCLRSSLPRHLVSKKRHQMIRFLSPIAAMTMRSAHHWATNSSRNKGTLRCSPAWRYCRYISSLGLAERLHCYSLYHLRSCNTSTSLG